MGIKKIKTEGYMEKNKEEYLTVNRE